MTRSARVFAADRIDRRVEGATLRAPKEDSMRRLPTVWTRAAFAVHPLNAERAGVGNDRMVNREVDDRGIDRPGD